jgi:hypothetical protein
VSALQIVLQMTSDIFPSLHVGTHAARFKAKSEITTVALTTFVARQPLLTAHTIEMFESPLNCESLS